MNRRRFLAALLAGSTLSSIESFGENNFRVHHVKKGDTLSKISRQYSISIQSLKRQNRLKSDLIKIGQTLSIPSIPHNNREFVKQTTRSLTKPIHPWSMIVGHHSGIKYGNANTYHKEHLRRGMRNGLAYHFVIGNGIDSGDGEIEVGPRWKNQLAGGHVKSAIINSTAIGICCVGNFEKQRPPARQLESFQWLCRYLQSEMREDTLSLKVHKEIDPHTLCPGRYFPTESLRQEFVSISG